MAGKNKEAKDGRVVSIEAAREDVEKWLNFKKVSQPKRDKSHDEIEDLVEAVSYGLLVINEDFSIKQKLIHKLKNSEGEVTVEELSYKARVKMSEIKVKTKKIKASDSFGMLTAYASALTGSAMSVLDALDTEDNRNMQAIAHFFL